MTEAFRQKHENKRRYHEEAITRLQGEYTRLQNRIETMCLDNVDGRVDTAFWIARQRNGVQSKADWCTPSRSSE